MCILVACTQTKREDSDLRSIQDAMKNANEMDAVYLEDINAESAKFRQVMTKSMIVIVLQNESQVQILHTVHRR